MKELCGQSRKELCLWLERKGYPAHLADQIFQAVYHHQIFQFSMMHNLDKPLRAVLAAYFDILTLQTLQIRSADNGHKFTFLFELPCGHMIESHLWKIEDQWKVCICTQVGCRPHFGFCASGRQKLIHDLSASQIIQQFILIGEFLKKKNERITHLTFGGVGESLDNYEALVKALQILSDAKGGNVPQNRITIETIGIVDHILRLAEEGFKVNLALSLHAPTQHLRCKLIPYASLCKMPVLMKALDDYAEMTGGRVSYEYTLLQGINDQPEHALALVELLQGKAGKVDLIPYIPIEGLPWKSSSFEAGALFKEILQNKSLLVTAFKLHNKECGVDSLQVAALPYKQSLLLKKDSHGNGKIDNVSQTVSFVQ